MVALGKVAIVVDEVRGEKIADARRLAGVEIGRPLRERAADRPLRLACRSLRDGAERKDAAGQQGRQNIPGQGPPIPPPVPPLSGPRQQPHVRLEDGADAVVRAGPADGEAEGDRHLAHDHLTGKAETVEGL